MTESQQLLRMLKFYLITDSLIFFQMPERFFTILRLIGLVTKIDQFMFKDPWLKISVATLAGMRLFTNVEFHDLWMSKCFLAILAFSPASIFSHLKGFGQYWHDCKSCRKKTFLHCELSYDFTISLLCLTFINNIHTFPMPENFNALGNIKIFLSNFSMNIFHLSSRG